MLNKIKKKVLGVFKNSVNNKKSIGLALFAVLLLVVAITLKHIFIQN